MRNSEHNDFHVRKKLIKEKKKIKTSLSPKLLKRNQKIARGFLHEYLDGKLLKRTFFANLSL